MFAVTGVEPLIPRSRSKDDRKKIYQFTPYPPTSSQEVEFPPHLSVIPEKDSNWLWEIFDASGLADTISIINLLVPLRIIWWPDGLFSRHHSKSELIDLYEKSNLENFMKHDEKDIKPDPGFKNLGYLDWYSDRRFAEQSLTGTNPTTIRKIDQHLLQEFIDAAQTNNYSPWAERLQSADPSSLFVQDCRYFREAVGAAPDQELKHQEKHSEENWACAAVSLYELHDDGKLHPVAIVCDYKKSMKESVTIFNNRMLPTDVNDKDAVERGLQEEKNDWPWRYAKTCAQVSDWIRHEVGVHLTLSHLVEEVIIVATKRCFAETHAVYKMLSPHWVRTLSLNAAARSTLVPCVIKDIVGIDLKSVYALIRYEFDNYDFVGSYVPNDLKRRGFPNTEDRLNVPKYKNYAYAKDMTLMWGVLRKYVMSTLQLSYKSDKAVEDDDDIQEWSQEIRQMGYISTFPDSFSTLDELCDAITMCIHIAAPFHTAVNYLQNFYQAFVFAKPPALCAPMPETLEKLQMYQKEDFGSALHIGRHRQWLLSEQLPWLLSFQVEKTYNLSTFAESHKLVTGTSAEDKSIAAIIGTLSSDLDDLTNRFREISRNMDKDSIPYTVLEPDNTAVSILI